jgi:hypothetical protein
VHSDLGLPSLQNDKKWMPALHQLVSGTLLQQHKWAKTLFLLYFVGVRSPVSTN